MIKNEIQKIQLEIMDYIHDFCVKNDLKYYIVGGTLIGAVRHKGFIPWDIDIDIAMPRSCYNTFKDLFVKESSDSPYEFIDPSTKKGFFKPHAIVRKRKTSLRIKDDKKGIYDYGVFVDVFPLDKMPENKRLQRKIQKKLTFLKSIAYCKTSVTIPKHLFKRFVKRLVILLLSVFSMDWVNKRELVTMTKYNAFDSNLLCNMSGKYSIEKETHPIETWGEPTLYSFEGRYYYGPKDFNSYLSKIYGDYMKLPPKEEQELFMGFFDDLKFDDSSTF